MSVYDYPEYYEIAFAFRDLPREVDFFEALIRQHSKVPVTRVLELASGIAPHLAEWHKRRYAYTGLDVNATMRRFARDRGKAIGAKVTVLRGDVRRLDLGDRRFDFAYVQLGSLYVESNQQFVHHLGALARALPPGALYVLDGVVQFRLVGERRQRWTMRRRGVVVKTTYDPVVLDAFEQRIDEHLTLVVNDHGTRHTIEGHSARKLIYPQELVALLDQQREFELVGWYNNFALQQPKDEKGRRQVVLRRR